MNFFRKRSMFRRSIPLTFEESRTDKSFDKVSKSKWQIIKNSKKPKTKPWRTIANTLSWPVWFNPQNIDKSTGCFICFDVDIRLYPWQKSLQHRERLISLWIYCLRIYIWKMDLPLPKLSENAGFCWPTFFRIWLCS